MLIHLSIAELINRPGINLEAADFAGWTALHIAMKNNLSEIVKVQPQTERMISALTSSLYLYVHCTSTVRHTCTI